MCLLRSTGKRWFPSLLLRADEDEDTGPRTNKMSTACPLHCHVRSATLWVKCLGFDCNVHPVHGDGVVFEHLFFYVLPRNRSATPRTQFCVMRFQRFTAMKDHRLHTTHVPEWHPLSPTADSASLVGRHVRDFWDTADNSLSSSPQDTRTVIDDASGATTGCDIISALEHAPWSKELHRSAKPKV